MITRAALALAALAAFGAFAETVTWDFPRTGSCHEGIAFGDGKTGVLVWGGGGEVRLTVGRSDLWDHRGGYPWTDKQSYTNIVAAQKSGDVARLHALFKKETPPGEPRNPYMLPLGRVVITIKEPWTLESGSLDTATGIGSFAGSGDGQIMQMDGQCAAATAVLEMMVHEVNGKVEFFKGCPESWREVSFENVALSDGRRMSGRRVGGKVSVSPVP